MFGKHIFGNKDIFRVIAKYTLEPLREQGDAALSCADIDGMDWVRLQEVKFLRPGNFWEEGSVRSDDVFALLKAKKRNIPENGRVNQATFMIKFSGDKNPRTVIIRPPNIAQVERDDDCVCVEKWLALRGFILLAEIEERGRIGATVEGT
jgi:hypothetical protein